MDQRILLVLFGLGGLLFIGGVYRILNGKKGHNIKLILIGLIMVGVVILIAGGIDATWTWIRYIIQNGHLPPQ